MSFDVFISYPHENKAIADAACGTLEAAGMRCWIAPRDVKPSTDWAASIIDAIDSCRVMVLIFSAQTNKSKQVHREVQRAFDQDKPVLPFRIENMLPEKTLAYYTGPVHWLDALTPPLEQHLKTLTGSVRALLTVPHTVGEKELVRSDVESESQGAKARRLRYEAEAEIQVSDQVRPHSKGAIRQLSPPWMLIIPICCPANESAGVLG
jgi:TIR domain